jgi:hypothetical protein
MSFIKRRKWALVWTLAGLCMATLVYAQNTRQEWLAGEGIDVSGSGITLNQNTTMSGTNTLSGATTVSGTFTASGATASISAALTTTGTVALNGVTTLGDTVLRTIDSISLTSPTVTFTAANANLVVLTSDADQTGIYPTTGTLYQELRILAGSGSNTMRFDDGTSLTLGGNITLTEGEGDMLTLLCTSADGDEWTAVSAHDN